MTIEEVANYLNFYINKYTGSWYTVDELMELLDRGQMALYSDYKAKYAVNQNVKDALAPFLDEYNFTTLVSGYVIVPEATGYLDLLDIQVFYPISNRTVYYPIKLVNKDERAQRLNSQINPVTVTSPIGEQVAPRTFRLYPAAAYNGNVTFLRRPVKPVFAYTVISGRVPVYNPAGSVQLEWRETEIVPILLKCMEAIGINMREQDVLQWSQVKTDQNFQGVNRL